jgi:hypothetical protein
VCFQSSAGCCRGWGLGYFSFKHWSRYLKMRNYYMIIIIMSTHLVCHPSITCKSIIGWFSVSPLSTTSQHVFSIMCIKYSSHSDLVQRFGLPRTPSAGMSTSVIRQRFNKRKSCLPLLTLVTHLLEQQTRGLRLATGCTTSNNKQRESALGSDRCCLREQDEQCTQQLC